MPRFGLLAVASILGGAAGMVRGYRTADDGESPHPVDQADHRFAEIFLSTVAGALLGGIAGLLIALAIGILFAGHDRVQDQPTNSTAARGLPRKWKVTVMPFLSRVILALAMASGLTAAELDLSEVLDRMKAMDLARSKMSQGYSSLRRYTLENKRFGTSAEAKVKMTYSSSGAKDFEVVSETGSGVIRKNVIYRLIHTELEASQPALRSATQITADNYSFSLLAVEESNGRKAYVLQAEPRVPTKYLFRGRVWIDAEDFAVTRIEASPAVKPSFWVRHTSFVHTYAQHGRFWLPVCNQSESDVRVYGKTTVTVEYWDYRFTERAQASASSSVAAPTAERAAQ